MHYSHHAEEEIRWNQAKSVLGAYANINASHHPAQMCRLMSVFDVCTNHLQTLRNLDAQREVCSYCASTQRLVREFIYHKCTKNYFVCFGSIKQFNVTNVFHKPHSGEKLTDLSRNQEISQYNGDTKYHDRSV